ncbi:hypothetical protein [Mesorhizobium sp.]|uniref:hypothetical protein n=1 Tax=Mesorhizobium sp. TaxID=1871066 RepID=UPI0025E667F8|nr:hypothetical protein [Mesorhizobium sp.]
MKRLIAGLGVLTACGWITPASAWWDEGHMQIALMAYNRLSDHARMRVDEFLQLNDDYPL